MATRGSFEFKIQQALWLKIYGVFTWSRSGYSIANNTSTISWTLTVEGRDGGFVDTMMSINATVNNKNYSVGKMVKVEVNGSTVVLSGTEVVQHTSSGEGSFSASASVQYGDLYTDPEGSGSSTFILDTLPVPATIISADSFNDEENPTIYFSNGSKATIAACIADSRGTIVVPYTSITSTSSSYTFNLTSVNRAALRKLITTGKTTSVRFYLRTTIEGVNYHKYVSRTLTLVNYEPVLNPDIPVDTNNVTKNLTGDDSKFVRYFSNAYFDMGAEAQKEATIDSRYVICGSTTLEDYTSNTGTIEGIDSNTFYFGVTDSRGYTTRDAVVVDLIPYVKLTASLTLQPLSLSGDLTFIISGSCYSGSFGKKSNSLEFEYGIRENGGDITWHIIQPTVTYGDNRYEATYSISGLNPNSVYSITSNVIDELMSVQSQSESITSTPIFDWGKNDFKHNTPVYLTKNLSLRTIDNDGNDVSVFNPCNPQGALVLGWGQYNNANGDTSVYGNSINLTANNEVRINGTPIGGKVLWEGVYTMNDSQVINLASPISEQINGIVLVFSLYTSGAEQDVSINTFFVSKKEVELLPGAPHTFFMMINSGFSVIGSKYLYIDDSIITGHATNSTAGTNNNMTFSNNRFVLRYVIGV